MKPHAAQADAPHAMPPMQLPLDFAAPAASLDNFVPGRNTELLEVLRRGRFPRIVYLWGPQACGKTHLLRASQALHGDALRVCDDVGHCDAQAQQALFEAFNATLHGGPALLVTGDAAPLQLALREDLRTRLGAGLVYEIHALSDDEKRTALLGAAHERGLSVGPEFADYVLQRMSRDLRSLMALLDALDRYALQTRRALTLPLLRQWQQSHPIPLDDRLSKPS